MYQAMTREHHQLSLLPAKQYMRWLVWHKTTLSELDQNIEMAGKDTAHQRRNLKIAKSITPTELASGSTAIEFKENKRV